MAENEKEPEPLPLSESWRELVNRNMGFDPDAHFEDMLFFDLRTDKPDWQKVTRLGTSRRRETG